MKKFRQYHKELHVEGVFCVCQNCLFVVWDLVGSGEKCISGGGGAEF